MDIIQIAKTLESLRCKVEDFEPKMEEARAAYKDLHAPPWDQHNRKMARLFRALDDLFDLEAAKEPSTNRPVDGG